VTWAHRAATAGRLLVRCARRGPRDGITCLLAWGLLHLAVIRLRLMPAWRPAPDRWSPAPRPVQGSAGSDVTRLVRLFDEAARHPIVGCWCLPRAVALRRLLRLHGLDAELALGLRKTPEGLGGHAWVVYHGSVLERDGALAGTFARCEVS
jgi:hypothetical protein